MSKTLKAVSATLCVLAGLTGCADTSEERAKRPSSIQTAQELQAMGRYEKHTDVVFFKGGLSAKIIGAMVSYNEEDYQRHDAVSGNTAYFEAQVWPKRDASRWDNWVDSPVLESWPNDEKAQAYADLQANRKSENVVKIATDFASETICAAGTVSLDGRTIKKSAPLTPAQNAQVLQAVGGKMERLLGMTQQDLDKLGIGFVTKRPTQNSPNFRYESYNKAGRPFAKIRLKCVF